MLRTNRLHPFGWRAWGGALRLPYPYHAMTASTIPAVTLGTVVVGGLWAYYRVYKRREHAFRLEFTTTVNFVGVQDGEPSRSVSGGSRLSIDFSPGCSTILPLSLRRSLMRPARLQGIGGIACLRVNRQNRRLRQRHGSKAPSLRTDRAQGGATQGSSHNATERAATNCRTTHDDPFSGCLSNQFRCENGGTCSAGITP